MEKIKCFIDESLIIEKSNMTHFTLFMSKIRVRERKHHYHSIKLLKYNNFFSAVEENYRKAIAAVRESMESRLTDHKDSAVFEILVDLLKTKV